MFLSLNTFKRDELFYCCSINLYNFLRFMKQIYPVSQKIIKKHNSDKNIICYIFVKCDKLQNSLTEWKNNKISNTKVFVKEGGNVANTS